MAGYFKAIRPSPLLAPYVRQYWFLKLDGAMRSYRHLVPAGSLVLSFQRGNPVLIWKK